MDPLEDLRRRVSERASALARARASVSKERGALRLLDARLRDLGEARALAQGVAEEVQNRAHARVAEVVTRCLRAVFGDDAYEFRVAFEKKRGRTEARLAFVRGGEEVDPLGAAGGGVVDVAAFALRLACLVLSRPQRRRLLILDEPAKHLSKGFRPAFARLLESISRELGVQVILVTHDRRLRVGKVLRLAEGHLVEVRRDLTSPRDLEKSAKKKKFISPSG